MSAGTRVINQFGTVQIGQDFSNYALDGGRTRFSVLDRPTGFLIGSSPPPGAESDSIVVTDNLNDQPYFGWGWGYCWVFKPAHKVGVSGVAGKRVRNPQTGAIVFDSGHRYLRVVDYIRTGSDTTKVYEPGRKYRVAPLSWAGLDTIVHEGDAGMGDGSQLYSQNWRAMAFQISGNSVRVYPTTDFDGVLWDGPPGMQGTVGADPFIEILVLDMTDYPDVY